MTARKIAALGLALAAACTQSPEAPPPADSAAAMKNMPGMEGMPGMPGMAASSDSGIPLDRGSARMLGISFARASYSPVRRTIRLAGTIAYAEPRQAYVNARTSGWVESLFADYVGKPVRAGDPLLAIYAPELVSAQEEHLTARRLDDSSLIAASRRRLELWNISADQIAALERRGTAERTLLLRAPRSGEIAEKMVIQGQAVQAGANLFLIADRSVLWVDVAVFEMDAPEVRPGRPVDVSVAALAGRRYRGRISFILPAVDAKTRTLTARVEVQNRDGMLRPGMYASAEVSSGANPALTVPLEAVLPTGERNLVFVNRGDGHFLPREVITGARNDSLIEIVRGLKPGEEVVAAAAYLLDSESNLAAAMQGLMLQMGMGLNMGGMKAPPDTTGKDQRP